jgi:hypothetical protein
LRSPDLLRHGVPARLERVTLHDQSAALLVEPDDSIDDPIRLAPRAARRETRTNRSGSCRISRRSSIG